MKKYAPLLFALCFMALSTPFLVYGEKPPTTSKWADLIFITTEELKKLYDSNEDFLLINALSPIEFAEMAIKGSVNIPYEHLKQGIEKLPADKSKKLVFYCKGPK